MSNAKPSGKSLQSELARVFLALALFLSCLATVGGWIVRGPLHEFHCEREYLPSVGRRLGFRLGEIPIPGYPELPQLGFVDVDRQGPMYAAGFRAGDIPLGRVDVSGTMELCDILLSGTLDEQLVVTTSAHWPGPEPERRSLPLPRPPATSER